MTGQFNVVLIGNTNAGENVRVGGGGSLGFHFIFLIEDLLMRRLRKEPDK